MIESIRFHQNRNGDTYEIDFHTMIEKDMYKSQLIGFSLSYDIPFLEEKFLKNRNLNVSESLFLVTHSKNKEIVDAIQKSNSFYSALYYVHHHYVKIIDKIIAEERKKNKE